MANSIYLYGETNAGWEYLGWERAGTDVLDRVEWLQDVRGLGEILAVDAGNQCAWVHSYPRYMSTKVIDPTEFFTGAAIHVLADAKLRQERGGEG